ncbi:MAG: VWA domain-containing protein [Candidatus Heimdallarchaeaceae archaeon]
MKKSDEILELLNDDLNRWRLILGKYSYKQLEFQEDRQDSLLGKRDLLTNQKRKQQAPGQGEGKRKQQMKSGPGQAPGQGTKPKQSQSGQTQKTPIPSQRRGSGGKGTLGINSLQQMDETLSFLYHREFEMRDEPDSGPKSAGKSSGGISIPRWINNVKELFPDEAVKILQNDALHRYKLSQLVIDGDMLDEIEQDFDLLKAILEFKNLMKPDVLEKAKKIIRKIAQQLADKIFLEVQPALLGKIHRNEHSPHKRFNSTDWKRTIEHNLKNYDKDLKKLIVERIFFWERRNKMRYHIVLVIDQSGSMTSSVIYSAVMAGIFNSLPNVDVSLVVFDTRVVDLSNQVGDIVELLLKVQLGGGTDIASAVEFSAKKVETPERTLFILLTDFYEGGNSHKLLQTIKELQASGTKMIGLAALNYDYAANYDHELARKVEEAGMKVAVLSPKDLAEWVAENMGS